jgi:hypothetical protein
MARWTIIARATLALGLATTAARAQAKDMEGGLPPAESAEREAVASGQRLLEQKQYRAAIELLKPFTPQLGSSPESRDLSLLLAAGYLGDNNAFWAIRTLHPRVGVTPDDCELRVWLGWAYFQAVERDRARELLDHPSCRNPGPQAARASLLRALLAKSEGQDEVARAELERARGAEAMSSADREALAALTQMLDPDRLPELSWKFDARQGYTTNPLLGSPTDPNASQNISDTTSGYYQLSGWFRFSPDFHLPVRPALEGEARTFRLQNPELKAQSYLSLTGRLGVFIGSRLPRLFIAWRPEYLRLEGGELPTSGPNWYVGAHRVELEYEVKPWLLAFAGGGRRDFRPMIRDRYELDGGLGGQAPIIHRLSMIWAVSGRKHWTDWSTYDLWGGSGLVNLLYAFASDLQPRVGMTLASDYYPHWNGYLGPANASDNRRDLFVKLTAALWSPQSAGFRIAAMYDYSRRESSFSLFEFSDHRISVLLVWSGVAEVTGPSRLRTPPLADIGWGLGGGNSRLKERVQEYLREDERTLQRSCGCRE